MIEKKFEIWYNRFVKLSIKVGLEKDIEKNLKEFGF